MPIYELLKRNSERAFALLRAARDLILQVTHVGDTVGSKIFFTDTALASVLVPLTTSLYVRGSLPASPKIIVDIGTGFFVEMVLLISLWTRRSTNPHAQNAHAAADFYVAKIDEINSNIHDLEAVAYSKSVSLRKVEEGVSS